MCACVAAASLFFRGGKSSPRCVTASTFYMSVYLQHWPTHTFPLHVGWGRPTSSWASGNGNDWSTVFLLCWLLLGEGVAL